MKLCCIIFLYYIVLYFTYFIILHSLRAHYWHFRRTCFLHFQGTLRLPDGCSRTPWNLGASLPRNIPPKMSPILPCVTAYSNCFSLFQTVSDPYSESQLLKSTQQKVEELLSSGIILHPYSLSLDMHASALQSLTSLHVVNRLKRWAATAHDFSVWDTSCSKNCLMLYKKSWTS